MSIVINHDAKVVELWGEISDQEVLSNVGALQKRGYRLVQFQSGSTPLTSTLLSVMKSHI